MNTEETKALAAEAECCESFQVHSDMVEAVRCHMPEDELLDSISDTFKVFGDKTRIKILYVLHTCELCVCDIAQLLDMNQSAISHQLRVLKQMKLVKNRREGKTVYYSLADGHIQNIISQGMEHIME